ncbi:hypothetical protein LXL04_008921 [Taraxacum kok-saghyz]
MNRGDFVSEFDSDFVSETASIAMNLGAVVVVATKAPYNSKINLVSVPIQLIGEEKCMKIEVMVDGGGRYGVSYNGLSAWERRRATAAAGAGERARNLIQEVKVLFVSQFTVQISSQVRLFEVDLCLFDGSQLETVAAVKGDNEEEKKEHAEIIAAEEPNADKAPCNNDATTKTCSEDYIALLRYVLSGIDRRGNIVILISFNTQVRGKILKISQGQDNHTLYLGNISKTWKQEEIKAEIAKSNPKKKSQKQIFRGGFKVEPSTTSNKKGGNVIKETSEPKSTKMKAQIKSNKKVITKNKSKVAIKTVKLLKKPKYYK